MWCTVMSVATQITLNVARELQLDAIKQVRKDLAGYSGSEIVKKLLYEKMDEIAPMPDENAPAKTESKGDDQ